jgi:dethiobiotin synthetase
MTARPLILFVTGTDTGVGKTVLAVWLVRFLVDAGVPVTAFKPVCSGGREDARQLHEALGGNPPLSTINPWHFRAPVAPDLAARREGRGVRLAQVLDHLRVHRPAQGVMLIEGAGGLLSPLGQDFDSRDLISALRAVPLVVCPNRLGAVNQVRLVLEALPPTRTAEAQVLLAPPPRPDAATPVNAQALARFLPPNRISVLPRIRRVPGKAASPSRQWRRVLSRLLRACQ